jgi:hypothetical protein
MGISVTVAQRRARLVRRHHLAPRPGTARAGTAQAGTAQASTAQASTAQASTAQASTARAGAGPLDVATDLVALHGTDPASVFLSCQARCGSPVAEIEQALYGDRTLHRMLAMRRTVFAIPTGLVPIVQSACTDAVAANERRKLDQLLVQAGLTDDPGRWLAGARDAVLGVLADAGEATGVEIGTGVPMLRDKVVVAPGTKYQETVRLTSRVLLVLAAEGWIARSRPRGSWLSSQFHWRIADPVEVPPAPEARAALARRWLRGYGPGTLADLKWWTGWTVTQARAALADIDAVPVDLDGVTGATGYLLPDDLDPVPEPAPTVALLPALDPTIMGWIARDWYLGPHGPALFDRNGNAGPTVWYGGRVVGGWAQRDDGEVVVRFLEDSPVDASPEVEALEEWLGSTRVKPRIRTPLERSL